MNDQKTAQKLTFEGIREHLKLIRDYARSMKRFNEGTMTAKDVIELNAQLSDLCESSGMQMEYTLKKLDKDRKRLEVKHQEDEMWRQRKDEIKQQNSSYDQSKYQPEETA